MKSIVFLGLSALLGERTDTEEMTRARSLEQHREELQEAKEGS